MCENRFPEMDETARSLMGSFKRLHYTLHKNMAGNVKHDLKMSPFFVMNHLLRADRAGQGGVRVLRYCRVHGNYGVGNYPDYNRA